MPPACGLCGTVWGRFRNGTVACLSVERMLSPSSYLDARHFTFSLYVTGVFQAATLVLELRGSESDDVFVWVL